MFRAKYVETPEYYKQKRLSNILLFVIVPITNLLLHSSSLEAIFGIEEKISLPMSIGLALLSIVLVLLVFKAFGLQMPGIPLTKTIEINEEGINITKKGEILESVPLETIKNIRSSKSIRKDEDTLKASFQDDPKLKNFVELDTDEGQKTYHFSIESEYSVKQLHKILAIWKGKQVEVLLT